MKIPCPSCGKTLSVADDMGGRRVKCPGCQQVFAVPASKAAAVATAEKSAAVKAAPSKPVAAPAPTTPAVKKGPPPVPAPKKSCPECGGSLSADGLACRDCDWVAESPKAKPRRAPAEDDGPGGCYIDIRRDEVELNEALEKRMKHFIETEQLDMRVMDSEDEPPEDLGPNDIIISGKVTISDYGSQLMRYFLTFVTMFGPGACKLEVEADVETADDERRHVNAHARQWIGLFGGRGVSMMKVNVKVIANRIATDATRHITGQRFLNAHVYNTGYWSLGLGLASLLPFFGIVLAPIAGICGIAALLMIRSRQLPHGKMPALVGLISSALGFLESAVIIGLAVSGK